MSSAPFTPRFDPATPLADFLEREYVPAAGCRRIRKKANARQLRPVTIQQLNRVVRMLAAYLHNPPTVADLTPDTLGNFVAWYRAAFPNHSGRWLDVACKALLRFVKVIPDERLLRSGRKAPRLTGAEGTLWHVCTTLYFPKAVRVRSDKTKLCYRHALSDFKDSLAREPAVDDLTDDALAGMMVYMQSLKRPDGGPRFSSKTVNERVSRVKALAGWLFRRGMIPRMPECARLNVPWRNPRAWTIEEVVRILQSCQREEGIVVPGISAADWWWSLFSAVYDCGERIGAMRQATWAMLNTEAGTLDLPAEIRKAKAADKINPLHDTTRAVLEHMREAGHELIWPWPFSQQVFYAVYKGIVRRAGLVADRKSGFHKMRRTTATMLQKAGIDASMALGHWDSRVTRESYLDVTQLIQRRFCDALPRPEGMARLPAEPLALPAAQPKRLTYRHDTDPAPELAWI